jgi:hypothetical protein
VEELQHKMQESMSSYLVMYDRLLGHARGSMLTSCSWNPSRVLAAFNSSCTSGASSAARGPPPPKRPPAAAAAAAAAGPGAGFAPWRWIRSILLRSTAFVPCSVTNLRRQRRTGALSSVHNVDAVHID